MSDDCNCETKCPGYAHCVCIHDIETGACGYHCNDAVMKAQASDPAARKSPLHARVNLTMRGASLTEAARVLSDLADADIYVPAARMDERRDLYLEDVSLDTVVRELDLLAVVGRQPMP